MAGAKVQKARCERSDLPVGQCGDTCCRPDLAPVGREPFVPGADGAFVPIQYLGTWREAAYSGTCACGCGVRYSGERGVDIVLADLDGSGGDNDGWCLLEHTRTAVSVFGGGH